MIGLACVGMKSNLLLLVLIAVVLFLRGRWRRLDDLDSEAGSETRHPPPPPKPRASEGPGNYIHGASDGVKV